MIEKIKKCTQCKKPIKIYYSDEPTICKQCSDDNKVKPIANERRTGRTTAIIAKALSDLLNNGECVFKDHVDVTKDGMAQAEYIIGLFKDKMNAFMGHRADHLFEFTYKGNRQVQVKKKPSEGTN